MHYLPVIEQTNVFVHPFAELLGYLNVSFRVHQPPVNLSVRRSVCLSEVESYIMISMRGLSEYRFVD